MATQILDGELFCFDYEVTTILEVLVGKTIEQSLMEVVEESELDLLKQHQVRFFFFHFVDIKTYEEV